MIIWLLYWLDVMRQSYVRFYRFFISEIFRRRICLTVPVVNVLFKFRDNLLRIQAIFWSKLRLFDPWNSGVIILSNQSWEIFFELWLFFLDLCLCFFNQLEIPCWIFCIPVPDFVVGNCRASWWFLYELQFLFSVFKFIVLGLAFSRGMIVDIAESWLERYL